MMRDVLRAKLGVADDKLAAMIAAKNRIARQMSEASPTPQEWAEIAPGVVAELVRLAA